MHVAFLANPSATVNSTLVVTDNDVLQNGCSLAYLDNATVHSNTTD